MNFSPPGKVKREEFKRIAEEALELIIRTSQVIDELCSSLSTYRLYTDDHAHSNAATRSLLGKIRALFFNRKLITVDVGLRRFLVNHMPIYEAGKGSIELHATFRKMGVGGITFFEGIDREQVTTFIRLLNEASSGKHKRDWLSQRLEAAGASNVILEKPLLEDLVRSTDAEEDLDDSSSMVQDARAFMEEQLIIEAKKVYQVAVGLMKDLITGVHVQEQINLKDITRIAKNIVEYLLHQPQDLVAVAIAGRNDDYQYIHPVNVAIFGGCMVAPFFQDPRQLVEFVRIALLCDVGKSHLPSELLDKTDDFDDDDWQTLSQYPVISANLLDRETDLDKLAVVVAFEHHLDSKTVRYPATEFEWDANLVTRIIRIAETFDALIGNRPHRSPLTPDEAINRMINEYHGTTDAPLIIRLFNAIGSYPNGSVVQLSTGEAGIVAKQMQNKPAHPLVHIVVDAEGRLNPTGEMRRTGEDCHITRVIPAHLIPFEPLNYYPFRKVRQKEK